MSSVEHDGAGNTTLFPSVVCGPSSVVYSATWDAWNRLIRLADTSGAVIATYAYDGDWKRMKKTVGNDITEYYYDDMQLVETRTNGVASEQFVYDSRYLHSVVCRDVLGDGSPSSVVSRLFYCNDGNFNVTALVNTNGTVVERYTYDPYGKVTIRDANWQPVTWDASQKNVCFYTGHKLDAESGLYYSIYRYYHPGLGRWATRDPLLETRENLSLRGVSGKDVLERHKEGYGFRFAWIEAGWWLAIDPIGARGVVDPYAFTLGRSLSYVDAMGLASDIIPGVVVTPPVNPHMVPRSYGLRMAVASTAVLTEILPSLQDQCHDISPFFEPMDIEYHLEDITYPTVIEMMMPVKKWHDIQYIVSGWPAGALVLVERVELQEGHVVLHGRHEWACGCWGESMSSALSKPYFPDGGKETWHVALFGAELTAAQLQVNNAMNDALSAYYGTSVRLDLPTGPFYSGGGWDQLIVVEGPTLPIGFVDDVSW